VFDSPRGEESEFVNVNSAPPASRILDIPEDNQRDPVLQHCKRSNLPIVWDRETFLRAGQSDRWEAYSQFGFNTGIALAAHRPRGRHFFISVDRDQALPTDPNEVMRMLADLQLFATFAEEAATQILTPARVDLSALPRLTPREVECLSWTMEGKTAWEVGCILSISEQTAVRHLNNATKKLDCVNKHHAVVKAMRLGLIS